MKSTLILLILARAVSGASAARADPIDLTTSADIRLGRHPPLPPPPVVIVVEEQASRGPALWERARW